MGGTGSNDSDGRGGGMKVYVLLLREDFRGDEFVSVHATLDSAKAGIIYETNGDQKFELSPDGMKARCANERYTLFIQEEEVQP